MRGPWHGARILPLLALALSVLHSNTSAQDTRTSATVTATSPTVAAAPAKEVRAGWFSSSEMRRDQKTIISKLKVLKESNFNTACFEFQMFGYASYPNSAFLPVYPSLEKTGDPVAKAVEETHRLGMRADLIAGYGFISFTTTDESTSTLGPYLGKHPDRVSLDSKGRDRVPATGGKSYYLYMCPANPANHDFLGGLCAEAVARYPVDGIILSNVWYRSDACHCPYCQKAFKEATGFDLKPFPAKSRAAEIWSEWKRKQLTEGMAKITGMIRRARPGISVTVNGMIPYEMERICAPWNDWLEVGIFDGASLRLTSEIAMRNFASQLDEMLHLPNVRPSRVVCAISCDVAPPLFLSAIEESRARGVAGQMILTVGKLDDSRLYVLRDGPYTYPVDSPLGPPMLTRRDADVE